MSTRSGLFDGHRSGGIKLGAACLRNRNVTFAFSSGFVTNLNFLKVVEQHALRVVENFIMGFAGHAGLVRFPVMKEFGK